jgi:hypothetical protein
MEHHIGKFLEIIHGNPKQLDWESEAQQEEEMNKKEMLKDAQHLRVHAIDKQKEAGKWNIA